tara:strand:- start:29709 stop:32057 length:2349 start_codon:yes stop_codon:yes gene_type:complete
MAQSGGSKAFSIRQSRLQVYSAIDASAALSKVAEGFVPDRVFDIHTHLLRGSDFGESNRPQFAEPDSVYGAQQLREGVEAMLPGRDLRALCFGIPARDLDTGPVNDWVAKESAGQDGWKFLALAKPDDDRAKLAQLLRAPGCAGFKVYHLFSGRDDSFDCGVKEFAPEWMWELLNEVGGVLMLHIVRDRAMADPQNQKEIRYLCKRYPNCQLVLAHVARSFSHRHALEGLEYLRDLDNAWIDTSAVCESQAFSKALDVLGPSRILYGSDYPISNLKGRSVTVGESFSWIYEDLENPAAAALNSQMALVGLESLSALREAAERHGCSAKDIEDIFYNNAARMLGESGSKDDLSWSDVKTRVSCGTGLMSKRQEQFDPSSWPTFYSRCNGSEVWDLHGKRFIDFAGGVGAIALGYGDEDVGRAVNRQIAAGTYCTLVNPAEDTLAKKLLGLHPWAGRVRFARGGGEAMAVAVRIARGATGRSGVAFCGYHGWQDWYLAANLSDDSALDGHLLPGLQPLGVPRELKGTAAPFRYNDLSSLREAIQQLGGRPAAIVMEPMRSQLPKDDFVEKAMEMAHEAGAVFVLDEVTSGIRFGFPGAHVRLGLDPDIAVYAKAMSNGFPFGAIVGRKDVMDAVNGSFISSSYWTDGVGTAAALACLTKVEEEKVSPWLWETGSEFQEGLRSVASRHPDCHLQVGGMPPSPSLTFSIGSEATSAKKLMIRSLLQKGFLSSSQLYLMRAHSDSQRESFLAALDDTLGEIDREIENGTLVESAGSLEGNNMFARLA